MKLVSFQEKRMALALGDYLSSIQLPNHLQHDAEGFSIVLENPDDFVQARQIFQRHHT
jgi:hypothetical protein